MYKILLTVVIMLITSCSERTEGPMIVAHRGASFDAPENTIPAFLLAWEQGADAIEGDFFLTADNEIVCIHDATTRRVSDKDLIIANTSLAELRMLDVGEWKDVQWKGVNIPTIAEVFQLVPPGKKILVEVKSGPEILSRLYEEIDNSGLRDDQIIIISFNSEVIREFKSSRPEHKAFWLSGLGEDDQGNIIPKPDSVINTLAETGADGFSSHFPLVTEDYIEKIKDAGYEYHVWTVNEPSTANNLWHSGVLSITTDKPGVMRGNFNKNRSGSSE